MPAQTLIESLQKLLTLHNQLHETAVEKTAALQTNNMEELNRLLREEQKYLASIQMADKKRVEATSLLTNGKQAVTVSEVIETIAGAERVQLLSLQSELLAVLTELKNANELNEQLLEHSLQFVHLNLDLLAPEPDLPNYSKTPNEEQDQPGTSRSIFDSKA